MVVLRLPVLWPTIWPLLLLQVSCKTPSCATENERYSDPAVLLPHSHEKTAADCQQRCAENRACQKFSFDKLSLPSGACWLYHNSLAVKMPGISVISGPKVCSEDQKASVQPAASDVLSTKLAHELQHMQEDPEVSKLMNGATSAAPTATTEGTTAPTTERTSGTTSAPTATTEGTTESAETSATTVESTTEATTESPSTTSEEQASTQESDAPEGGLVEACEGGLSTGCPVEWQTGEGGYYCYETQGCRPVIDGPFPLENCQDQCYIGEVEVPGGGNLAVPFDCYADLEYVGKWSPMKQQWCCENSPVASIVCEKGHSSGVEECEDHVGTSCPPEWHTGPTGGYYCSDGPAKGGCRPSSSGAFTLEDCQVQCTIGHCASDSDSTSGPPEPEIWSCGRHLDRWEWWPEEKKEYCCQHDEQAKKLCGHFGEAEESPGRPPRCSSEDAAACPDNWATGHSGGYLCTGQGDPAKGGCRPSSEGPYPVEDCQEQCCIGHTALAGHHPKPEFWDCNRNLGRWKWWPEEKKMYCCKEAKTTPLFCSSYVDRDHVWGHMWRCAHDVGTECPESWRTDSSGGYFCSSGTAAGACRSAADEPFPLEDCQEQCTIGAVSLGGHTPLPDIWDCRAMLTHWESWAEEKKLWCCAHDPEARSVCGHYAAAHSSVSCNANTAGGMDCQFPFQWHGETHNSCYIESNRFGGEPWCIRVDGTWAACDCGPGHGEHTDITHVTHVHPGHYHHSQDHHHYDCENKDTAWSNTKTQWCCAQTEGCNSTGSEPFDCTADLETWEHDWSLQKKSWCWDTDQQVDDDMFDCDKGLENADRGWSADKKDWCCSHKHKGCEQFFNCDLGLENWETAWNATKKKWCWDHEQKGYSKLYNCHDQLANFSEAWTSQKKVWCCANEHLGCGETYDCETGFEQWEILWTTPQKHFCCHTEGKACYDCAAGFANWERGWSAAKKAYCCDKEHKACSSHSCLEVDAMSEWSDEKRQYCCSNHNVACHDCNGDVQAFDAAKEAWCCENEGRCLNSTTTTASPCPDAGFNEDDPDYCNTPIGTWTVEKKAFCCQHFHRGCPGVTYDCDVDSHIWQYAWSLTKKAWCCVHHHVGCYPHYDCDTAVTSWSPEKKVWCCHHEKKGCELYDCYGPPHLWSEPHKDWCCRNHGQGCSEEEPFHCHGGAGQNIYWSPEKKDWCCTHKHIGCSEPHFGGGIHHEHHDHHEHHEHESCSSICHWDGQSHTCKDRIKYAASHRFQNQKHACTAAVHLVAGECDHCGACTVQRSGCYVYWHKELSHHTTSHVVTTVTHLGSSFNCHDGMEDMWAQEKRDFCCWKHRKGCPEPVVPAETYNCDAGFDKWETEWEAVQKEWCCKHRSRACQRFQCDLGLHDFATLWGPPKKVWCCKHEGKGCIAGFQWFDCTEKAEHWERDWTAEKKGWCCSHKKMGCPGWHWHPGGVTHVSHTTYTTHHHSVGGRWVVGWHDGAVHHLHHVIHKSKLHFDCHAALSNWEDAWSPDKKLWCWTNKRLGFSKLFNCKVGEVASWSATKEAWCREHLQIGAPVAAAPAAAAPVQGGTAWGAAGEFVHTGRSHYNCDSALQNWENAWSEGKKTWCWSHLRKGGPEPYSCHDGKAGIWSAPKREWCCDHKKEACPEIARRLSDSESSLYA